MKIQHFFDPDTYTLTYVVYDPETKDALVIDPVLNYDPKASKTSTASVDQVLSFLEDNDLRLHWVLETHAHADHLTGAPLIKKRTDAKIAIGAHITKVQDVFKNVFGLGDEFLTDASQFDATFSEGETIKAGSIEVGVIETPGHTPACVTYQIGDAIFTGDALFMHDYGTGRCDFPKGSASDLYNSVHDKLYNLPDETRVFVGHDYSPGGREVMYETTIGKSKAENPQLTWDTSKDDFVKMRETRDATLDAPRLLLPSVQININAGKLPQKSENGMRYLNIPINMSQDTDETGDPAES